jgi:peptide/nickel transport system ATP-binding protein
MVDASLRATILGTLHTLHLERGISLLYITHDLATAYQISDNIVVLYRGAVVEAGAVDLVVKQPRHPYTQLLMSAIPLPSAERTWSTMADNGATGLKGAGSAGCKFADRCPHAIAPCLQAPPPLFHTDRFRAVACYLYQSAPALAVEELGRVFTAPAR